MTALTDKNGVEVLLDMSAWMRDESKLKVQLTDAVPLQLSLLLRRAD